MLKQGKIFGKLGKNVQNLKIFGKGQMIVCDNYKQITARIGHE